MFVKIYRYRVLPAQLDKYLAVQERALRLYEMYAEHQTIYLQCTSDLYQWMEVHYYRDEASCQQSSQRLAANAEARTLWNEFRSTLDPSFPSKIEEYEQRTHFIGDGPGGAGA